MNRYDVLLTPEGFVFVVGGTALFMILKFARNYNSKIIRVNNVKVKIVDKFMFPSRRVADKPRFQVVSEIDNYRNMVINPSLFNYEKSDIGGYGIMRETVKVLRNGELDVYFEFIPLDEYKEAKGVYEVEDFNEEFRLESNHSEEEITDIIRRAYSYKSHVAKDEFDAQPFILTGLIILIIILMAYLSVNM